jgi:hypothetical protein
LALLVKRSYAICLLSFVYHGTMIVSYEQNVKRQMVKRP